jgi:hypothetical protein
MLQYFFTPFYTTKHSRRCQYTTRHVLVLEMTDAQCWTAAGPACTALFVWTYQHNQQLSSSVFLSQQISEQYFQHNKPAKRTGCTSLADYVQSRVAIRLPALIDLYIHPLYVLVSKILSSILNSFALIHPLYHSLFTLSTVGPTYHFI